MRFTTVFGDYVQSSLSRLIELYGMPRTTIEVGVFEGHTTFNLTQLAVENNPDYRHYAIDPHFESHDIDESVVERAGELFQNNLTKFTHRDNIEYLNKTSWEGLLELYSRGVRADLIYIDGDHRAATVLEDLVLAFNLIDIGGVILCDDCVTWKYGTDGVYDPQNSPKMAVDNFLQCNWDRVEILLLPNGYQTAFRRIK